MTMRVLIVDDEPLARERARSLLERARDVEIAGECGDALRAAPMIREQRPNVLLLDIQMPERSGFDILRELDPSDRPLTIFMTAHDRYALEAFEVHALDYLLKPVDESRFRAAFERARNTLAVRQSAEIQGQLSRMLEQMVSAKVPERIAVRSGPRTLLIAVDDIEWIESAGNYVRIHHRDGAHLLRETLSGIEKRLFDRRFARVQRTVIVNLDRVIEVRRRGRAQSFLVLRGGRELPLGRLYRAALEERLGR